MKRITRLTDLNAWDNVVWYADGRWLKAKILVGDGIKWLLDEKSGTIVLNSKTLRACKIYK